MQQTALVCRINATSLSLKIYVGCTVERLPAMPSALTMEAGVRERKYRDRNKQKSTIIGALPPDGTSNLDE
ncbi:hypothetical protein B5X24_HaOG207294 [Helicoverpa armigera]|uniref:Uncharacterized protein n=1 Tax=Helicoverpa armigera TaxID=29058 RepID=A0A2W1BN66_HELAM|nr:hypothetical protein B5X24_HaOG207294 [Helicoverpa armigera]